MLSSKYKMTEKINTSKRRRRMQAKGADFGYRRYTETQNLYLDYNKAIGGVNCHNQVSAYFPVMLKF
jgi:hypothetical protein